MVSEIVKIIDKIASGITERKSTEEVLNYLSKESKFDKSVVAAAYSWICEKTIRNIIEKDGFASGTSSGIRVLSTEEVSSIGLNNYNYLLHFYNIGLLTNNDLDLIVEQIKLFPDEEISLEHINTLILALFLDPNNFTLPGSRLILYSSDTIN